jgi:hypothetical protein
MPLLQWGAYLPDVSDYEGSASRNVLNVLPRGDGYGPFPSFSAYTSALPAACRGAFYALKSDGSVITFAGTSTKLYQLNNTNFSWTDVSLGAGTYSALSRERSMAVRPVRQSGLCNAGQCRFAGVRPVIVNGVCQLRRLASAGGLYQRRGPFLVLSGLLSNPYRIQWSGLNASQRHGRAALIAPTFRTFRTAALSAVWRAASSERSSRIRPSAA